LCNRRAIAVPVNEFDRISGPNIAFFENAEVKSRAALCDEASRHLRVVHSDADAVARYARLTDLEYGAPDAKPIPDAHFVVRQTLDRKILAELSRREIRALQRARPEVVRGCLVHEERAMFAAVSGEVALTITIDVQAADGLYAVDGLLPNAGEDALPAPLHVFGKTDVDGNELCHKREALRGTAAPTIVPPVIANLPFD
jgi:hypothetical protein